MRSLFTHPAWPHARAALIAAHVVGVVLASIPAPSSYGTKDSAWSQPTVRGEVEAWARRFSSVGLDVTPDGLASTLQGVSRAWRDGRRALLAPWLFVQRHTGTTQTWTMFTAPDRHPTVFSLELKRGDRFDPVYVLGDDAHRWRSDLLDEHRVRRAMFSFGWHDDPARFERFCDRVAALAFVDHPDANAARCRLVRTTTLDPDELRARKAPARKTLRERLVDRS